MAAADPVTPERRFAIRLPRLLWIGLAAVGVGQIDDE